MQRMQPTGQMSLWQAKIKKFEPVFRGSNFSVFTIHVTPAGYRATPAAYHAVMPTDQRVLYFETLDDLSFFDDAFFPLVSTTFLPFADNFALSFFLFFTGGGANTKPM